MSSKNRKRYARSGAIVSLGAAALLAAAGAQAGSGRFLATGGIQSLSGAAGGGINPWAVIAGYGTNDQIGGTASYTNVTVPDFNLNQLGASIGLYNRVELSYAYQTGRTSTPINLTGLQYKLGQQVFGAKVRLFGDAVYDQNTLMPQVAAGIQYKRDVTGSDSLATLLNGATGGATKTHGTDFYVSATKLFIGGFFGYDWLVNGNLRLSKANETGLLGFGGPGHDKYKVRPEFSTAVLLRPDVAIGYEFKRIGNNLDNAGLKTSNWQDVFIAYFPNKSVSIAAAYAHLGSVGGSAIGYTNENGLYLNATLTF